MDRLASVLLLRAGQLHVPVGEEEPDGFEEHLEIDLAERGWLMDAAARDAVARLPTPVRTAWADWLLATIDADSGADRSHVPLFRRFPQSTPKSTEALYVDAFSRCCCRKLSSHACCAAGPVSWRRSHRAGTSSADPAGTGPTTAPVPSVTGDSTRRIRFCR